MSLIGVQKLAGYTRIVADSQLTMSGKIVTRTGYKFAITPSAVVCFAGQADFRAAIIEAFTKYPLYDDTPEALLRTLKEVSHISGQYGLQYQDDGNSFVQLLVVTKSKTYIVYSFTILEVLDNASIGSPQDECNILMKAGIDVFDAVVLASKYDLYCSGPFDIIEVQDDGTIIGDVLADDKEPVEDSYSATIDFVPREEEVEDIDTFLFPEINVIAKYDTDHDDEGSTVIV